MRIDAIVYTSSTGFTARYANLLSERAVLPVFELEGPDQPVKGAAVLYLGWLCANSIKGLRKARKRYEIRGVCAVGMAPAEETYAAKLRKENGLDDIPFFYLRGGYAPERLTGVYKLMMAPMAKMVAKAPAEDAQAREMRAAFIQGGDWVAPEALEPVMDWLAGG